MGTHTNITRFYLYFTLIGLLWMPTGYLAAVDTPQSQASPDQTAQSETPLAQKWRKKKKKKPSIAQSWKKVVTLDWDAITPHDERNLLVSTTCAAILYSCYYVLTSRTAPIREHNDELINPEPNRNPANPAQPKPGAKKKKKKLPAPPTYTKANITLAQHRIIRPTAIQQSGNAKCGIYAAHNASQILRYISQKTDFVINSQDDLLQIMNTVLAQDQVTLNTRLDANTDADAKNLAWAKFVCQKRNYDGLKGYFYKLLHKALILEKLKIAQENAQKERSKKYSGLWQIVGWFMSIIPTQAQELTPAEKLAVQDLADFFAKYILAGKTITLDTLVNQNNFAERFNEVTPLVIKNDDPEYKADGERGQKNKINSAHQLLQNNGIATALANTFGTDISLQKCKITDVDMTGNNLSSDETTLLLKKAKLTYSILEDMDEYDEEVKKAIKAENEEKYDLNGKATAIDTSNANQTGFYRNVINEVKKQMYASTKTFAHAFLIRTGRAEHTVDADDNTQDITAALSATGVTHWVTLVVIKARDANSQWRTYYLTVDSMNCVPIDSAEYKDIIEILEPDQQNQQPATVPSSV